MTNNQELKTTYTETEFRSGIVATMLLSGMMGILIGLFLGQVVFYTKERPKTPKQTVVVEQEGGAYIKEEKLATPHDIQTIIGYTKWEPKLKPIVDEVLADDVLTKEEHRRVLEESTRIINEKAKENVKKDLEDYKKGDKDRERASTGDLRLEDFPIISSMY